LQTAETKIKDDQSPDTILDQETAYLSVT